MPQVPFTPAGVAAKTTELYALTDAQLLVQAQLAGTDFRTWFEDNFTVSQTQSDYLDEVPANVLLFWGYLFGGAILGRRTITMMDLPPEPVRTKEIKTVSALTSSYIPVRGNDPAQVTFGGTVTFEFETE